MIKPLEVKLLSPDLQWTHQMATLDGRFPGGQNLLFQGLWTDPVTGLSYARNRWYDARNASWLSEDPKGAIDSTNLYAFVGWGPHVFVDPLGRSKVKNTRRTCEAVKEAIKKGDYKVAGRTMTHHPEFKSQRVTTRTLADSRKVKVNPERLRRIDEKFPDLEVPYDDVSAVDFRSATHEGSEKLIGGETKLEKLSGNSAKDRRDAWAKFQDEEGLTPKQVADLKEKYRMHHHGAEGEMLLVEKDVHMAFTHTGPDAWERARIIAEATAEIGGAFVVGCVVPETCEALQQGECSGDEIVEALTRDLAYKTVLSPIDAGREAYDVYMIVFDSAVEKAYEVEDSRKMNLDQLYRDLIKLPW